MIDGINSAQQTVLWALEALERSHFHFHLTGSRFFGGSHDNSDWDFFAQFDLEIEKWLSDHSFEQIEHEYNNLDANTSFVWEKNRVQIQLVNDYGLKIAAQNILNSPWIQSRMAEDLKPYAHIIVSTKNQLAKPWWNWAFEMARKQPWVPQR